MLNTYKKPKNDDEFLKLLHDNKEIQFVRLWFPDLLGNQQCEFSVPKDTINETSLKEGFGYDGSSVLGQARINESDKIATPDATTAVILPWNYKIRTSGIKKKWKEVVVFANILNPDGTPYQADSRTILKNAVEKSKKELDIDIINFGPEAEYFLFESNGLGRPKIEDGKPITVDYGTYYKAGRFGEVRKEVQLLMNQMGFQFEYDHHEVAPSQHENIAKYMDAISMADFLMLYKYMVRRVARSYGLFASFMPKPLDGENGSGMHVHQSLIKKGKNLFFDTSDEHYLSKEGKQYMAGLMKHIPEITSILNPWVNSYKRLVPGYEAPVYICWDPANRSNLIRKPEYSPGKELATRLELRSPDPATNPYLAFAVMLRAGVKGITEGYEVPAPTRENVYNLSEKERKEKGIKSLPGSLEEALEKTKKSELVKETLGDHLFEAFITDREKHVAEYNDSFPATSELAVDKQAERRKVSKYEIEKLLPIL